jgi:hypothetical protein
MLKKILIALLALIAIFVIVVALQPSEFHVERTATMAAPPATVSIRSTTSTNGMHGRPGPSSIPMPRSRSKVRRQAPARS